MAVRRAGDARGARTRRSSRCAREHEAALARRRRPTASCGGSGTRASPRAGEDARRTSRRRSTMREKLGAMPFVVRENATRRDRRLHALLQRRRAAPPARDRPHVVREARAAHGAQHRVQAAAARRTRSRRSRCIAVEFRTHWFNHAVARGDRAARREAGRHPAQPPDHAGRRAARHRRVQHHRRRMAGGEAAPRSSSSSGRADVEASTARDASRGREHLGTRHWRNGVAAQ